MAWIGRFIASNWGKSVAAAIVLIVVASVLSMDAAGQGDVIKSVGLAASGVDVEIELESTTEFAVRDELTILRIGPKTFTRSRHPADGDLKRLIFALPPDEFAQLQPGDTVTVEHGRNGTGPRRNFGELKRDLLGK